MGSASPLDWIGLGSDVVGMGSSYAANQYAADKQYQATKETNEQNYKIWQESQDFSREQANTQWEREKEMFNMENSYNNPANVVGRLREAGLNPALAMQGSLGSAMSSAASGGSPTIGSTPTAPTMQVPAIGQYYSNIANGISDASLKASMMLKNLAEAKKQGIETSRLESTIDDYVQQAKEETRRLRLENFARVFETEMLTKYGEKIKKNELESLIQDVSNKILEGDNIQADTYLKNQQGNLVQFEGKEKEAYVKHIEEFIQNMLNLGKAQINTEQSKQALNYQQAQTEHDKRSLLAAQTVQTNELAKLSKAERLDIIENSISLYEDATGIHINDEQRKKVTNYMERNMVYDLIHGHWQGKQAQSDYYNPFKYVGYALGASGSVSRSYKVK